MTKGGNPEYVDRPILYILKDGDNINALPLIEHTVKSINEIGDMFSRLAIEIGGLNGYTYTINYPPIRGDAVDSIELLSRIKQQQSTIENLVVYYFKPPPPQRGLRRENALKLSGGKSTKRRRKTVKRRNKKTKRRNKKTKRRN
jgi:hypothetical protein